MGGPGSGRKKGSLVRGGRVETGNGLSRAMRKAKLNVGWAKKYGSVKSQKKAKGKVAYLKRTGQSE